MSQQGGTPTGLDLQEITEDVNDVVGDLRDYDAVHRLLTDSRIDSVFHLAAQAIVGDANASPVPTFETNIEGTWSTLEACRRSPAVTGVVFASSDKAYGDQPHLPYDETTPLQGSHPYDVSKSCADLIAQAYAATYGSRWRSPAAATSTAPGT